MYYWDTKIRYVKGLGPTRSKELTKIGIETVGDLLERRPLSYIYPGVTNIADAKEGMVVIKARIKSIRSPYGSVIDALLNDGTAVCCATWYYPYATLHLHPGMTATFWGKMKGGVLQQPCWTTVPGGMDQVVGGQYGVHHATIRAALVEVLANVELPLIGGSSRVEVFQMFHFPQDKYELKTAVDYFKHDEALTLQLALAERRRGREGVKGEVILI